MTAAEKVASLEFCRSLEARMQEAIEKGDEWNQDGLLLLNAQGRTVTSSDPLSQSLTCPRTAIRPNHM